MNVYCCSPVDTGDKFFTGVYDTAINPSHGFSVIASVDKFIAGDNDAGD
jgi:hypothetical protein